MTAQGCAVYLEMGLYHYVMSLQHHLKWNASLKVIKDLLLVCTILFLKLVKISVVSHQRQHFGCLDVYFEIFLISGCDWSIANDLLVTSSSDGTVRLWDVSLPSPKCLRAVTDSDNAEVLCCAFVPANSNMVVAGNGQGLLQVLNVSTGIYPRPRSNGKIGGQVLSIACEATGHLIWAGNNKVNLDI